MLLFRPALRLLSLVVCIFWMDAGANVVERTEGLLCGGKGYKNSTTGECLCINGHHGYDCQFKYCPFGASWNSEPQTSHVRNTENVACSNMGECDRATGKCVCRAGFEGRACERLACAARAFRSIPDDTISIPTQDEVVTGANADLYFEFGSGSALDLPPAEDGTSGKILRRATVGVTAACSGHGICRTMREAGMSHNGVSLVKPYVYYDQWDADKIQGCLCDAGWEGYDCSFRSCPKGRDPYSADREYAQDEVYTIQCQANNGSFALGVFGMVTAPIPHDADPEYVRRVVSELDSVKGDVLVIMQENNHGLPTVCEQLFPVQTTIQLLNMPGRLPPLRILRDLGPSRQWSASATQLQLGIQRAPIHMVSVYTIECGHCVDCFGNIHFTYGDSVSAAVDIVATGASAAIESALLGMDDFNGANWPGMTLNVSTEYSYEDKICVSGSTNNTVIIEIYSDMGNIPGLGMIDGSYAMSSGYVELGFSAESMNLTLRSNSGNGTLYECSNHGKCDRTTGTCHCNSRHISGVQAFSASSSDGRHNQGSNGDCGHIDISTNFGCRYSMNSSNPMTICSGHGHCNVATNKCFCSEGWHGIECAQATCPKDYPFFAEPNTVKKARWDKVECSDMGICDRMTGMCHCRPGFVGPACNILDCDRDSATGDECSGQGRCENLHDTYKLFGLAYGKQRGQDSSRPETWDATRIRNCLCSGKRSDGRYAHPYLPAVAPKTDVGKWSTGGRPLPGFGGYKCQQKLCPVGHSKFSVNSNYGINDLTAAGSPVREIQRVVCTLNTASEDHVYFTLSYYGHATAPIYPNYDIDAIKTAIEANPVLGNVTITMDVTATGGIGTDACDATGVYQAGVGFTITFDTEGGDIPLGTIIVENAGGDNTNDNDLTIAVVQNGNSELRECGGDKLGYCDYDSGLCQCRPGRVSSDQNWHLGDSGECGYRLEGRSYSPTGYGGQDE